MSSERQLQGTPVRSQREDQCDRQQPSDIQTDTAQHIQVEAMPCQTQCGRAVFSRIGQGLYFDHHYVQGLAKIKVKVPLAMVIALANVHIEVGQPQNMRSLICPLALPGPG